MDELTRVYMNKRAKRTTLLMSTALGLQILPAVQAAEIEAEPARAQSERLDTVTVTAEKFEESSLDVPMGLTALSGEDLVRQQSYRLEDFVGQVPGLNLVGSLAGSQLVIRGIASTEASINAPVATYIDDTPLVGIGAFSGGSGSTPNLDTFDMNRIEVLKGPQGTLYGADALGGLVKYVTNAPDPAGFAASVQTGGSTVSNGGTGFDAHGMINVPLTNDLAFRLVAYDNYYPGFIDDPARGRENINGNRFAGGRASLLWNPVTSFSIRFNALYQAHSWGDLSAEDVNPGSFTPIHCNLCQERLASQPGNNKLQYYNTTVNWDMGPVKLLSSTSYYQYSFDQDRDLSVGYGALATTIFNAFGFPGSYGFWAGQNYDGHSWVHETRLASNSDGPLQWQAGVYYTGKSALNFQDYFPIDALSRTVLYNNGLIGTEHLPTTYKEIATFANLDWHITPTFDVAAGGRFSHNKQTFQQIGTGLDVSATIPQSSMHDSVFTYSGDVRWHFTPQSMVYARVAEGFVPGGPNDEGFTVPVPPTYEASTTINYEIGIKNTLLDNHLTVELSAFQIDWRKIQLVATVAGYSSLANGGTAKSQGLEWNFSYVPVKGLTLDINGAYTDARLTQDSPGSVGGLDGDRLPITPLWQGSASANYERPLFGAYMGFAGVSWRFTGSRYAEFEPDSPRLKLPSLRIADLRAGIETQRWTLAAYVKNVGNTVAISYVDDETLPGLGVIPYGGAGPQSAYVALPRTIGAELTVNF